LLELKVLRDRVGIAPLGAAVVDDLLVILLLFLFVALVSVLWAMAGLSSGHMPSDIAGLDPSR
jgi:Kef-type K+ transport system membrane component KefB